MTGAHWRLLFWVGLILGAMGVAALGRRDGWPRRIALALCALLLSGWLGGVGLGAVTWATVACLGGAGYALATVLSLL